VHNVIHWVENNEQALNTLDPANAGTYQANATAYTAELGQLDAEIETAVAAVPPENRKLVTDHESFGHFATHYGFTVIGSVIPSISTLSSPSAQELAALQQQITEEGVKAIFVGTTTNPALAEQIANDISIQVVPLYAESLSEPGGPAPTYLDFMRYDVSAIVEALK
jgi:ABC-type Zn uptake system ZnuABC Zn-binding protein ZnuA